MALRSCTRGRRASPAALGIIVQLQSSALLIYIARPQVLREQGDGGHDHAGLAVAALHDIELSPSFLQRVWSGGRQAFDGRDLLRILDRAERQAAGARRCAIDEYRACTTGHHPAAILGAGSLRRHFGDNGTLAI